MLYRKYGLYNGDMEIMLPSSLIPVSQEKETDAEELPAFQIHDASYSQYMWVSEDKKTVINIATGALLEEQGLVKRVQDYYMAWQQVNGFTCQHVKKRTIHGCEYGEMLYLSEVMGYRFYHEVLLGSFQGSEWMMNLQCLNQEKEQYEHIFSNITDSIYIKKQVAECL